jgi:hypothetical protein
MPAIQATGIHAMTIAITDYNGPCLILLDRAIVVDVRRGGRTETVAMPRVERDDDAS